MLISADMDDIREKPPLEAMGADRGIAQTEPCISRLLPPVFSTKCVSKQPAGHPPLTAEAVSLMTGIPLCLLYLCLHAGDYSFFTAADGSSNPFTQRMLTINRLIVN